MEKVFLIFCLGHQFFQVLDYIPRTRIISILFTFDVDRICTLHSRWNFARTSTYVYMCTNCWKCICMFSKMVFHCDNILIKSFIFVKKSRCHWWGIESAARRTSSYSIRHLAHLVHGDHLKILGYSKVKFSSLTLFLYHSIPIIDKS